MEFFNQEDVITETGNNDLINKTFFRMFLGLLATAITAFYTYSSGLYLNIPYGVLCIIELAVVLIFSLGFRKWSPTTVTILFFGYAFLNGMTLAVIFAAFELGSIGYALLTTAVLFGALSAYGYITKKDISKVGSILMVALCVGLVMSIINLFIGSTMFDIILDWFTLAIFCGLTIYDVNKIKALQGQMDSEKLYVYGAMELYLDFINIFLRILSLFGKRKD